MSGGHCLLAIVDSVDKFYTLGTALDNAPGEVLDKVHLLSHYLRVIYVLLNQKYFS